MFNVYDRDWDCMVLIVEHVCDVFASHVLHDDQNKMVVGGGMGEVPYFGGMMAPRFAPARYLMNQDLHAKRCYQRGIKQEGPFQCFVCG